MFPNATWRTLYEGLQGRYSPGRAEREYLGILALGLEHPLEALETALDALGDGVTLDAIRRRFAPLTLRAGRELTVDFSPYDALLKPAGCAEEAA